MANLKKADLSAGQQDDLNLFTSVLAQRGWHPTGTFGAFFVQGWAVPYQAEFTRKKDGTSSIARYVCGQHDGKDLINVTLHTVRDHQMVAFRFDRLSPRALAAFMHRLERLPNSTSVPDTFRRFRLGRHQQVDQVTQA